MQGSLEEDLAALLRLRSDDASGALKEYFGDGEDPREWSYKVGRREKSCVTIADGRVTKLDLRGCSSLAALPAAIGELKALTELNLSECSSLEKLPDAVVAREGLTVVLPTHLVPGSLDEDFAALRKLRDECECEAVPLIEGVKVKANYRGCLVRVRYSSFLSRVPRRRPPSECSHAGAASSISERLRGTTAMIRTTSSMMTERWRRTSRSA